jgi:hypothetical protein
MSKKLPPYGKPLQALLSQGGLPDNVVNLWIGMNAWHKGTAFNLSYPTRTLVLPPWICPTNYYWPVNGCDVMIFDTGYADLDYIENIAYCLFQDGANKVYYSSPEHKLTVYLKD